MKVSPRPFCVLDEIEAALDDVNADHYASLSAPDERQHPVYRHHPPPRHDGRGADVLYGVTMQDEGVSKLWSCI